MLLPVLLSGFQQDVNPVYSSRIPLTWHSALIKAALKRDYDDNRETRPPRDAQTPPFRLFLPLIGRQIGRDRGRHSRRARSSTRRPQARIVAAADANRGHTPPSPHRLFRHCLRRHRQSAALKKGVLTLMGAIAALSPSTQPPLPNSPRPAPREVFARPSLSFSLSR